MLKSVENHHDGRFDFFLRRCERAAVSAGELRKGILRRRERRIAQDQVDE